MYFPVRLVSVQQFWAWFSCGSGILQLVQSQFSNFKPNSAHLQPGLSTLQSFHLRFSHHIPAKHILQLISSIQHLVHSISVVFLTGLAVWRPSLSIDTPTPWSASASSSIKISCKSTCFRWSPATVCLPLKIFPHRSGFLTLELHSMPCHIQNYIVNDSPLHAP